MEGLQKAVKTGIFSRKENISRLALILAVILVFLETATKSVYAGSADHQFGDAYGANNNDEEFYSWCRVADAGKQMYTYLDDYNEHKDEYENGSRTFRVLLTHHIKTSPASSIAGVEGTAMGFLPPTTYSYNMDVYYQADWTRVDYGNINHVGESLVATSKNPQIDLVNDHGGKKGLLFTRGSQRTFICKSEKGKNNSYYFYYPDESDKNPQYMLSYGNSGWTKNLYVFDEAGNAWGRNTTRNKRSDLKVRDTWSLSNVSDGRIFINTNDGKRLGIGDFGHGIEVDSWALGDNDKWDIYVGCPSKPDNMSSLNGSENGLTLGNGTSKTIDVPTYVKKNETLTIAEGAVLYVDNILVLNGKIKNSGIIVVNPGGAICEWDKGLGSIECDGGDVLVRKQGQIFVDKFKADKSRIMLYCDLTANIMEINNSVIDYNGNKKWLKGARQLKNFIFLERATKEKTGEFVVDFMGAEIQKNGSGEKKDIKNTIEH